MNEAPSLQPRSPFGDREVAPGVSVFTSAAYALNSGAVAGTGDARAGALLIDPAFFPSEIERIAGFLESRGLEPARIVLTHSDWDHVLGPARFPNAAVVASSEFPARAERDRAAIEQALAEIDMKLYVARAPAFRMPKPGTLAGSPVDLVWPGPPVRLLPAGGHTRDGLMVLLRDSRVLFAGDHLSDLEIPFVGDSVGAYLRTLAMVRALTIRGEVEVLVAGHGAVCGRDGIEQRLDEDEDYLTRLEGWVRDVGRTVTDTDGILERSDEVVFRKGSENPDIRREHRANVARCLDAGPGSVS